MQLHNQAKYYFIRNQVSEWISNNSDQNTVNCFACHLTLGSEYTERYSVSQRKLIIIQSDVQFCLQLSRFNNS